jgi:tryptophan 2,3-dioxygenase
MGGYAPCKLRVRYVQTTARKRNRKPTVLGKQLHAQELADAGNHGLWFREMLHELDFLDRRFEAGDLPMALHTL